MSVATIPPPAKAKWKTLDELLKVEGKAELIRGRIEVFMPAGTEHILAAGEIHFQLKSHCKAKQHGQALTDNALFAVPMLLSGRESFSPDVGYLEDALPRGNPKWVDGPPDFAVEVRSPGDRKTEIEAKRRDYFEAGTKAVWDVDPVAGTIELHRPEEAVVTFRRGEFAHAEPVVKGWLVSVNELLDTVH